MKILIFGDVYGRVGRKALTKEIQQLKNKYNPEFTVVNIENITSGRGPVSEHAEFVEKLGVDVMTGGDHIYDNIPNIYKYLEKEDSKLIRPANFYDSEGFSPLGKDHIIVRKRREEIVSSSSALRSFYES